MFFQTKKKQRGSEAVCVAWHMCHVSEVMTISTVGDNVKTINTKI